MAVVTCQGCGAPLPPSRGGPPRKWCSNRCRKAQYDLVCEDCGGRASGTDSGRKKTPYCLACSNKRNAERTHIERRALVEAMWADGLTARQIAVVAGWTHKNPSVYISLLRAKGYDLPYRYSPERIARSVDSSTAGLAKARAVYREMRAA